MKKTYTSPSLAVYGKLEGITLGVGGTAPDVAGISNNNCLTGTVATNGATVTISCATVPS